MGKKKRPQIGEVLEQVQVKGWWKSKTVIANIVGLAVAGLELFTDVSVLPNEESAITLGIVTAIGVYLRFVTNGPVGMTKKGKPK